MYIANSIFKDETFEAVAGVIESHPIVKSLFINMHILIGLGYFVKRRSFLMENMDLIRCPT